MGVALASLLMSAAIPTASSYNAALFAVAYVAMQVGRNIAQMLRVRRGDPLRPLFEQVVGAAPRGSLGSPGRSRRAPYPVAPVATAGVVMTVAGPAVYLVG
jgi:hypothetical protein